MRIEIAEKDGYIERVKIDGKVRYVGETRNDVSHGRVKITEEDGCKVLRYDGEASVDIDCGNIKVTLG